MLSSLIHEYLVLTAEVICFSPAHNFLKENIDNLSLNDPPRKTFSVFIYINIV